MFIGKSQTNGKPASSVANSGKCPRGRFCHSTLEKGATRLVSS